MRIGTSDSILFMSSITTSFGYMWLLQAFQVVKWILRYFCFNFPMRRKLRKCVTTFSFVHFRHHHHQTFDVAQFVWPHLSTRHSMERIMIFQWAFFFLFRLHCAVSIPLCFVPNEKYKICESLSFNLLLAHGLDDAFQLIIDGTMCEWIFLRPDRHKFTTHFATSWNWIETLPNSHPHHWNTSKMTQSHRIVNSLKHNFGWEKDRGGGRGTESEWETKKNILSSSLLSWPSQMLCTTT